MLESRLFANQRDASPRACALATTGAPAAAFLFVDLLNSSIGTHLPPIGTRVVSGF